MPKVKTRKSLVKRIKITARGKLMTQMKGINHLRSTKSKSRLRRSKKVFPLHEATAKRVRQLINK